MTIFQFTNEYNRRLSSKKKDGSIVRFSKNKGYESIPRELAQNENLSYEARGLLISIASYPEAFKLYKCELYQRSVLNNRRKIDRCWQELIDAGFVLQFRKREGRSFVFSYLFSLEPFSAEELLSLFQEAYDYNFHYYHKRIRKYEDQVKQKVWQVFPQYLQKNEKQKLIDWLKEHGEIREEDSNAQNEHSRESPPIHFSSNVQDEHSKKDGPKRTNNKLINHKPTIDKKETKKDTEIIDTQRNPSTQLLESLSAILTETFLSEESLSLIAGQVESVEEAKEIVDLLYKAKKFVQDHLDGLTIVAEYFEEQTDEMLQRYFFQKRTKKLVSASGYLYNMARNHWLQMADLMLHQGAYPNKEKYMTKCNELYQKLRKTK